MLELTNEERHKNGHGLTAGPLLPNGRGLTRPEGFIITKDEKLVKKKHRWFGTRGD